MPRKASTATLTLTEPISEATVARCAAVLRRMLAGDAPADVLATLDQLCSPDQTLADDDYVTYTPETAWYVCRQMAGAAQDLALSSRSSAGLTVACVLSVLDWAGDCLLHRDRQRDANLEVVSLLVSLILADTDADVVPYSYLWSAYRKHAGTGKATDAAHMLSRKDFNSLVRALVASGSVCPPGEWVAMPNDAAPRRLHVADDDVLLRLVGPDALVSARNQPSLHRGLYRRPTCESEE